VEVERPQDLERAATGLAVDFGWLSPEALDVLSVSAAEESAAAGTSDAGPETNGSTVIKPTATGRDDESSQVTGHSCGEQKETEVDWHEDSETDTDWEETLFDEAGVFVGTLCRRKDWPRKPNQARVLVPESTLVHPAFLYEGDGKGNDNDGDSGKQLSVGEDTALNFVLAGSQEDDSDYAEGDFEEVLLENFTVYVKGTWKGKEKCEMRPLYSLYAANSSPILAFEGTLVGAGKRKSYVRDIPFDRISVGNFGANLHSVDGNVWIESLRNRRMSSSIFYRLGTPSKHYARFHASFLWVADLAKHFTDYLTQRGQQSRRVGIVDFRENFALWLQRTHGQDGTFRTWYSAYRKPDFCVPVAANVEFLFNQAHSILGLTRLWYHHVFGETLTFSCFPIQGGAEDSLSDDEAERITDKILPTIVTPYIADLFSHEGIACRSMFMALPLDPRAEELRTRNFNDAHMALYHQGPSEVVYQDAKASQGWDITVGDTISVLRDDAAISNWRRTEAHGSTGDDRWFGLVQNICEDRRGRTRLNVIWYYRPEDTICGSMKYPVGNELFLSDNCTCTGPGILESEILGVHEVAFPPDLTRPAEFIVRQTYYANEKKWVSFRPSHKICPCRRGETNFSNFLRDYRRGDTVLARGDGNRLDVCEIDEILADSRKVRLRLLLRRIDLDRGAKAPPNEVVYSSCFATRSYGNVESTCLVRFFPEGAGKIPVPYSCGGVGNAWILSQRCGDGNDPSCIPLSEAPPGLRQGFLPNHGRRPLQGLDLFCGSGNFGRGLEEGGAVEMRWANDINVKAIHTYMANAPRPKRVTPFCGSIDDLQKRAIQGRFSDAVPEIGQVGFISGGSPCPGFSLMTIDKTTPAQRKNQSLVASFASMVDVYRPRHGILENVVSIVQPSKKKGEDHFCQLICAIVGMGYQTRMILGDAWSYGSCQSRSRVFLVFAAPGEKLAEIPFPTHSHPAKIGSRGVGSLPNGDYMVAREFHGAYAFNHASPAETMADLPDSWDTAAGCIPFPDHIQAFALRPAIYAQLQAIPHFPRGLGFVKAWDNGKGPMLPGDRSLFPDPSSWRVQPGAKGWTRIRPGGLIGTVTTVQHPTDRKTGASIHWDVDRPLTLMEFRRAQGFPDHEVLLGTTLDRLRAVGNSVARQVAIALGLAFRDAVSGLWEDGSRKSAEPATLVTADTGDGTFGALDSPRVPPQTQDPGTQAATPSPASGDGSSRRYGDGVLAHGVTAGRTETTTSENGTDPTVASQPRAQVFTEAGLDPAAPTHDDASSDSNFFVPEDERRHSPKGKEPVISYCMNPPTTDPLDGDSDSDIAPSLGARRLRARVAAFVSKPLIPSPELNRAPANLERPVSRNDDTEKEAPTSGSIAKGDQGDPSKQATSAETMPTTTETSSKTKVVAVQTSDTRAMPKDKARDSVPKAGIQTPPQFPTLCSEIRVGNMECPRPYESVIREFLRTKEREKAKRTREMVEQQAKKRAKEWVKKLVDERARDAAPGDGSHSTVHGVASQLFTATGVVLTKSQARPVLPPRDTGDGVPADADEPKRDPKAKAKAAIEKALAASRAAKRKRVMKECDIPMQSIERGNTFSPIRKKKPSTKPKKTVAARRAPRAPAAPVASRAPVPVIPAPPVVSPVPVPGVPGVPKVTLVPIPVPRVAAPDNRFQADRKAQPKTSQDNPGKKRKPDVALDQDPKRQRALEQLVVGRRLVFLE
jgi:DNA (cytosine-5)-methyltransferase 1